MTGLILPYRGISPTIAEDAFIAETAVVIGDVVIGPGASIWYGCVLRGDVNKIRVGRNTNLQDGTIVHCNDPREGDYREIGGGEPTHIGNDVVVGHMALIHACTVEDERGEAAWIVEHYRDLAGHYRARPAGAGGSSS